MLMNTPPILFMIFRRPENTAAVFATIRAAQPAKLFIAADGPRANRPDDVEKCAATRAVVEKIDWPCEVHKLFREKNLGCGVAVHEALMWFFGHVEEGIVLEDDIVAEPTFFPYCATLLERYRENPRIMMIAGYNPLLHRVGDGDYFASSMTQIWGWATWRRAINLFDFKMETYPEFKSKNRLSESMISRMQRDHFTREFDMYHEGPHGNWDHQWMYSLLNNRGLCLIPSDNLVKNIGFGPDSTFAANSASYHARRKTKPMPIPPRAPSSLEPDKHVDRAVLGGAYGLTITHQLLVKIATPFAPAILKTLWWLQGIRKKLG